MPQGESLLHLVLPRKLARLRVTFGAARVVMAVIVQWTAGLCCSERTFVNEKVILCSAGTWGALVRLDVRLTMSLM